MINSQKLLATFGKLIFVGVVVGLSHTPAGAQSARPLSPIDPIDAQKGSSAEDKRLASMEEEMLAKSAIKAAEKARQENLSRARDLSFLGAALASACKQKSYLDREALKKLEKAEKLAKGIRRAAGGSEDEIKLERPPTDLASALTMFAEITESLKDKVEKTPKHVVSAAVIDEANVLLELIRFLRALPPKA